MCDELKPGEVNKEKYESYLKKIFAFDTEWCKQIPIAKIKIEDGVVVCFSEEGYILAQMAEETFEKMKELGQIINLPPV